MPSGELAIVRRLDALHLDYPPGTGRHDDAADWHRVDYRKPTTLTTALGHKIYPYVAARVGDRAAEPSPGMVITSHPDRARLVVLWLRDEAICYGCST